MTALPRVLWHSAVYVVLLAPLAGMAWWWLAVGGCDLSGLAAQLRQEERRRVMLDRQARATFSSAQTKAWVTQEVIAGRMTLSEAAVHFQQLEEVRTEAGLPAIFQGHGEEAAWANVIAWVKEWRDGDPARVATAAAALEAEFRLRFGHAPLPPEF